MREALRLRREALSLRREALSLRREALMCTQPEEGGTHVHSDGDEGTLGSQGG